MLQCLQVPELTLGLDRGLLAVGHDLVGRMVSTILEPPSPSPSCRHQQVHRFHTMVLAQLGEQVFTPPPPAPQQVEGGPVWEFLLSEAAPPPPHPSLPRCPAGFLGLGPQSLHRDLGYNIQTRLRLQQVCSV